MARLDGQDIRTTLPYRNVFLRCTHLVTVEWLCGSEWECVICVGVHVVTV